MLLAACLSAERALYPSWLLPGLVVAGLIGTAVTLVAFCVDHAVAASHGSLDAALEGRDVSEPVVAPDGDVALLPRAYWACFRAQERLQAAYRALVDDLEAPICRFGRDGRLVFANRAYARNFGLGVAGWASERFPYHEGLDPARGGPWLVQREWVSRAGERIVWVWVIRCLTDARGAFLEFQAVGREVRDLPSQGVHQSAAAEATWHLADTPVALLTSVGREIKMGLAETARGTRILEGLALTPLQREGLEVLKARLHDFETVTTKLLAAACLDGKGPDSDLASQSHYSLDELVQVFSAQATLAGLRVEISRPVTAAHSVVGLETAVGAALSLVLQTVLHASERGVVTLKLARTGGVSSGLLAVEAGDATPTRSPETRAQIMQLFRDEPVPAGLQVAGEVRRIFLAKALLERSGGRLSAAVQGAAGLVFTATVPIRRAELVSAD